MPTNFQISSAPALRCVTGESYPLTASERADGFFSRLKFAERLVIHSGPQRTIDRNVPAWTGCRAQLEIQTGFRKSISHA